MDQIPKIGSPLDQKLLKIVLEFVEKDQRSRGEYWKRIKALTKGWTEPEGDFKNNQKG